MTLQNINLFRKTLDTPVGAGDMMIRLAGDYTTELNNSDLPISATNPMRFVMRNGSNAETFEVTAHAVVTGKTQLTVSQRAVEGPQIAQAFVVAGTTVEQCPTAGLINKLFLAASGAVNVYRVGSDSEYVTIQAAIDAAESDGPTAALPAEIWIPAKQWDEDIVIRKSHVHLVSPIGQGGTRIQSLTYTNATAASIITYEGSDDPADLVAQTQVDIPNDNQVRNIEVWNQVSNAQASLRFIGAGAGTSFLGAELLLIDSTVRASGALQNGRAVDGVLANYFSTGGYCWFFGETRLRNVAGFWPLGAQLGSITVSYDSAAPYGEPSDSGNYGLSGKGSFITGAVVLANEGRIGGDPAVNHVFESTITATGTGASTLKNAVLLGAVDLGAGTSMSLSGGLVKGAITGVGTFTRTRDNMATDKLIGRATAGTGSAEEIACTAAGRALLDDADATAQRATLGLGSAATADTGDFDAAGAAAAAQSAAEGYADGLVVGLWDDRGSFDASINTFPTTGGSGVAGAILKGDVWTISVIAGSGPLLGYPIGSTVRAIVDTPGQTVGNWTVLEVGLGYVPENSANKNQSGGYAGLTLLKLNLRNAADTITSWFTTAATVARTWTMPNRDGEVALISDVAYDATSWNGNLDAPTKNAVRDKIESMPSGTGGWTDSGTTISTTDPADKVGIGVTPVNALHVAQSAAGDFIALFQNTSATGLGLRIIGSNTTGVYAFLVRDSVGNDAFRVDCTQHVFTGKNLQVGKRLIVLGAEDASASMHVTQTQADFVARFEANGASSLGTLISGGSTATPKNLFELRQSNSYARLKMLSSGSIQLLRADSGLETGESSWGIIDAVNRRLGVGTASPTVALDVVGEINATADIKTTIAGKGFAVKEGSNAKMGTAVLVGGTVTVSTTAVTANSRIFLTTQTVGGTIGVQYISARTAGTSFDITSSSGSDTSTVAWLIVEPA
jgi:hypothetical protein